MNKEYLTNYIVKYSKSEKLFVFKTFYILFKYNLPCT